MITAYLGRPSKITLFGPCAKNLAYSVHRLTSWQVSYNHVMLGLLGRPFWTLFIFFSIRLYVEIVNFDCLELPVGFSSVFKKYMWLLVCSMPILD